MDEQDQHVFWLNGLTGTGKSTNAQTFAEMSFADRMLGDSFFRTRDFQNRGNPLPIFLTIALQLAYRYPSFREELLQILRANPGVGWETLCWQMETHRWSTQSHPYLDPDHHRCPQRALG